MLACISSAGLKREVDELQTAQSTPAPSAMAT